MQYCSLMMSWGAIGMAEPRQQRCRFRTLNSMYALACAVYAPCECTWLTLGTLVETLCGIFRTNWWYQYLFEGGLYSRGTSNQLGMMVCVQWPAISLCVCIPPFICLSISVSRAVRQGLSTIPVSLPVKCNVGKFCIATTLLVQSPPIKSTRVITAYQRGARNYSTVHAISMSIHTSGKECRAFYTSRMHPATRISRSVWYTLNWIHMLLLVQGFDVMTLVDFIGGDCSYLVTANGYLACYHECSGNSPQELTYDYRFVTATLSCYR